MFFLGEKVSNTTAGLIGEHIAASAILQRGWACAMAQQDTFDLVAINNQETYKVQVKACAFSCRGGNKRTLQFITGIGKHKRLPTRDDWDILACVSSEQRAVIFLPVSAVKLSKITLSINLFTPDEEYSSWAKTIEDLQYEKKFTKPPTLHNNRSRNGSSRNRIISPPNRRGS